MKSRRKKYRTTKDAPSRPVIPRAPELLAPAGSPATWAAAIEAGADAVYLGLKSFSARAFAANFTMGELNRVVELSHERGRKVFLAFNSIIKESELADAARTLDALTRIGPDALIVQDLGLVRVIKTHFPQFEVHASTLTAVHNATGLRMFERLGFDRAVLARELTLREVGRLAAGSPIGLEIFIHGALCFSFSGLCLMSSYLGGKSSLRGACTQPCRRHYSSGRRRGYFFSPTDLDASDWMKRIRGIPLAALKIEGRMKGADYVSRVVGAYRMLLDAPPEDLDGVLIEARRLLEGSPGRSRSSGFLNSPRGAEALAPTRPATSGLFIGRIGRGGGDGGRLELQEAITAGDRLRVVFARDREQKAFTLKGMVAGEREVQAAGAGEEVQLRIPFAVSKGDMVFKVGSARDERDALASPLVRALSEKRTGTGPKPGPSLKRVLADIAPSRSGRRRPEHRAGGRRPERQAGGRRPAVWFKVARSEDVSGLARLKPDRVILPLTTSNVKRMAGLRRRIGGLFNKIVWNLPPLVFDESMAGLQSDLSHLARMGAREYMISNLGQLPLVDREEKGRKGRPTVYADYRLNVLNSQTEAHLAGLGLAGVTFSVEMDEENLSALLSVPAPLTRMIYLYGRPALFTSRFRPDGLRDNLPLESPRKERFRVRESRDFFTVFPEKPVYFAPLLKGRSLNGVGVLILDFEFDPRPAASASEVAEAVARGRPIGGTSRFNYRRGLF